MWVLVKVSSKWSYFIRCRIQHLCVIEMRRYSSFTLNEITIGNSSEVTRARFLAGDRLFCFISITRFSVTILQQLLACHSVETSEKCDLCKLWLQSMQLKIMEMSKAWLDIYNEGHIHQLQPGLTHKML